MRDKQVNDLRKEFFGTELFAIQQAVEYNKTLTECVMDKCIRYLADAIDDKEFANKLRNIGPITLSDCYDMDEFYRVYGDKYLNTDDVITVKRVTAIDFYVNGNEWFYLSVTIGTNIARPTLHFWENYHRKGV